MDKQNEYSVEEQVVVCINQEIPETKIYFSYFILKNNKFIQFLFISLYHNR